MKGIFILVFILTCVVSASDAQKKYLSDIYSKFDHRNSSGLLININSWYFDTCLFDRIKICKENTSAGARVKIINTIKNRVTFQFLLGNNSGYMSKNPNDTLTYLFDTKNINSSIFIRKLLIKEKYFRIDTFHLTVVDTLMIYKPGSIKKAFGKEEADDQKTLKIFVLKSIDSSGSVMLHYWVERIGIIKLTDENCWRYSFEMNDDRTKDTERLFVQLMEAIKAKYKDPHWTPKDCYFE